MTIEEILKSMKTQLSEFVTADNTEKVSEFSKSLDNLSEEAQKLQKDNLALKDKIVEIVKGTITTNKPVEENHVEAPKSLDEIMQEEALKIINKEKK